MKAVRAAPLPFAKRLRHDAGRGEWRDGEARYLFIRHDSLMGMFRRLPPAARAQALAALAASVADAGGRSAARYRADAADTPALLDVFADTAARLGWGRWTFMPAAAGTLVLEVANSPFAAGFGASAEPVCGAIAGMAAAIAGTVLGRPCTARETACASANAPVCRFIALPTPA